MDNKKPETNSEPFAGKPTKLANRSSSGQEPDNDFIVTEANECPQQLVGEDRKQVPGNDLGIQSTTTIMDETANESGTAHSAKDNPEEPLIEQPLGSSTSILVPDPDHLEESTQPTKVAKEDLSNNVRHLSEKEIKSIRSQLYNESDKASNNHQPSTLAAKKPTNVKTQPIAVESKPFGNTPIAPQKKQEKHEKQKQFPAQPVSPVKMEKSKERYSHRMVAHFYKNFIHLPTGTKFGENDEFSLNNKRYVIKRKNVSPKFVFSIAVPIFIILAVVIVSLLVGGETGVGRVFGVVVDDYGVPYGGGATIRFTDLNMSYTADVQGLFATDRIPTGSHNVEYVIAGTVIGNEFVTIVDNDITTLVLAPSAADDQQASTDLPSPVPAKTDYSAPPEMISQQSTTASKATPTVISKKSIKAPVQEAKLVLSANVEGATLSIDGKVVGIGNTTYTRLTPGKSQYSVTRKGFDTVSGTVNLKAGAKQTIEVTLSPISAEAKAEIYTAEDYFHSGQEFVSSGNIQLAIDDYTRAITINPGYAEAYVRRGNANQKAGQKRSAFDDFLRAGEIYKFQRTFTRASSAFSNAIDIYPRAIEPLLGRGHTYLAKGENIAAITDFETAVGIDKKSPAARFGLGVARFNHGQYKKATNEFKKARSIDPNNPTTHQYLMLSYLARNDTKNVRKSYDKFIEIASNEQVVTFHSDKRFTAVIRVVEMEK